ncbi:MAG: hypothetical protein WC554_16480 [Clostridia bacterium]
MKIDNYRIRWFYPKDKKSQRTVCVLSSETSELAITEAKCIKTDEFNKEIGRKLSLSRALQTANVKKEDRSKIWDVYRNLTAVPRW